MDKLELLQTERKELQDKVYMLEAKEMERSEAELYGWNRIWIDHDIEELKNDILNLVIVIVKTDQEARGIA